MSVKYLKLCQKMQIKIKITKRNILHITPSFRKDTNLVKMETDRFIGSKSTFG